MTVRDLMEELGRYDPDDKVGIEVTVAGIAHDTYAEHLIEVKRESMLPIRCVLVCEADLFTMNPPR